MALGIELPERCATLISTVEDPFVALTALDLRSKGLAPKLDIVMWASMMTQDNLYSEFWPLAYEAYVKGWLPSADDPPGASVA